MKTAKAALFFGANEDFRIRSFPVTATPSGYARAELIASGVCGTDLHFHRGTLAAKVPSIIGHEFVGRITEMDAKEGEKFGLSVGDAVIADIAVPCGRCALCRNGDDANCVNMQVTNGGDIETAPHLWGGYAQVNYTPLANLIKIPASVDPFAAAVFACPGPTALHAFSLAKRAGVDIASVNTALVQGLGPVGFFAALYLCAIGVPNVYVVTAHGNEKRDEMAAKFGVKRVFHLDSDSENDIRAVLDVETQRMGVDLAIEASGAPKALPLALNLLRNRGTYLIPGQYSASGGVSINPEVITFKALHIIGSSQYAVIDVQEYLSFLAKSPTLQPLIRSLATSYPVDEVNLAFAHAKAGKNIKTVLVP